MRMKITTAKIFSDRTHSNENLLSHCFIFVKLSFHWLQRLYQKEIKIKVEVPLRQWWKQCKQHALKAIVAPFNNNNWIAPLTTSSNKFNLYSRCTIRPEKKMEAEWKDLQLRDLQIANYLKLRYNSTYSVEPNMKRFIQYCLCPAFFSTQTYFPPD